MCIARPNNPDSHCLVVFVCVYYHMNRRKKRVPDGDDAELKPLDRVKDDEELKQTKEALKQANAALNQAGGELKQTNEALKKQANGELQQANQKLQTENQELKQANQKLLMDYEAIKQTETILGQRIQEKDQLILILKKQKEDLEKRAQDVHELEKELKKREVELARAETRLDCAETAMKECKAELQQSRKDCEKYRVTAEELAIFKKLYKEDYIELSANPPSKKGLGLTERTYLLFITFTWLLYHILILLIVW